MNVRPGTIGHVTGEAMRQRVFPQTFVCLEGLGAFRGGRAERTKRAAGVAGKGRGRHSGEGQNLRGNKSFMRGQAMILTLAALFFLVLMTLATYNLAQITHSKAQTLNAADAGAYAAAVVTARHANFMAYTNRAMIANHVFVGQIVSLISFSKLIKAAAEDGLDGITSDMRDACQKMIPYYGWNVIGIPCYATWFGANSIVSATEQAADLVPNIKYVISYADGTILALSVAQYLASFSLLKDVEEAVDAVVEANDTDLEANTKPMEKSPAMWAVAQFGMPELPVGMSNLPVGEKIYSEDDEKRRFRKLINNEDETNRGESRVDSLDKFTKKRDWKLAETIIPTSRMKGTGGTALGDDNKTWLALDAVDALWTNSMNCQYYYGVPFCFWFLAEPKYPLAAQGAIAGNDDADEDELKPRPEISSRYRDKAYDNRGSQVGSYGGLRAYHDRKNIGEGKDTSWPIMVKVSTKPDKFVKEEKKGSTRTPDANSTFGTGKGREDGLGYDLKKTPKIESLGSAEVYFRQPSYRDTKGDNSDKYKDFTAGALVHTQYDNHKNGVYASYFSPYWQARLVDPVEKITDELKSLLE